jgi:hypothetical protein
MTCWRQCQFDADAEIRLNTQIEPRVVAAEFFYWQAGAVCCRHAGKYCVGINTSELLSLLHPLQWSACEITELGKAHRV